MASKANQLANFPLNFLRTGYYDYPNGAVAYRATRGTWWSATRSSTTNANYLYMGTGNVRPQHSDFRGYGLAVRWGYLRAKTKKSPLN